MSRSVLNVEKLKLGANESKFDFELLPKMIFRRNNLTISTAELASQIDTDLAQNEMQLYLIFTARQLNLSYVNEYTCTFHRGDIVKITHKLHIY